MPDRVDGAGAMVAIFAAIEEGAGAAVLAACVVREAVGRFPSLMVDDPSETTSEPDADGGATAGEGVAAFAACCPDSAWSKRTWRCCAVN